ncbi:site-specific DNA-methyltransferase [Labrys sp. KB_33_2]
MPSESVQCCVTSPPYFGLRDYDADGQIGLEQTPAEFVEALVRAFREVQRVLRDDGTLWLNLGDSYANVGKWGGHTGGKHVAALHASPIGGNKKYTGLKPKDLIGIPWRVAFALQADGWYLRSAIIWAKPNPMPESVTDRPTSSYEHVFLFAKSERYFYDAGAIAEGLQTDPKERYEQRARVTGRGNQSAAAARGNDRGKSGGFPTRKRGLPPRHAQYGSSDQSGLDQVERGGLRNRRNVWTIATQPSGEQHHAMMPPALAELCMLAGSRPGDTVLDPFGGPGTTGLVADRLGRDAVLIEINPKTADMARARMIEARSGPITAMESRGRRKQPKGSAPLFEGVAE